MKIRLWKGYHCEELQSVIAESWAHGDLLLMCPPLIADLDFVDSLPHGTLTLCGDWELELHEMARLKQAHGWKPAHEYPVMPALGVFTTGTTSGKPRLVLYSRENIESSTAAIMRLFDRTLIKMVFCYPQPFYTFGLTLGYMMSLLHGLKLVSLPGRYTAASHDLRLRISSPKLLTLGTPAHFQDLRDHCLKTGRTPAPSYASIVGGARVTAKLWRIMRDELLISAPSIGYGATEAAPGVTHQRPGVEPTEDGEIGEPLPHLVTSIRPGEGVEFYGPATCLAIVSAAGVEFPHTILLKDNVRTRADGRWVYEGRLDLTLNRGGQKFSLEHIEEKLKTAFGFEALCVPVPHGRLGEDLGILLKGIPSNEISHQRRLVGEYLRGALKTQFELGGFLCVDDFPINANAKTDRKASAQLLTQQMASL